DSILVGPTAALYAISAANTIKLRASWPPPEPGANAIRTAPRHSVPARLRQPDASRLPGHRRVMLRGRHGIGGTGIRHAGALFVPAAQHRQDGRPTGAGRG